MPIYVSNLQLLNDQAIFEGSTIWAFALILSIHQHERQSYRISYGKKGNKENDFV